MPQVLQQAGGRKKRNRKKGKKAACASAAGASTAAAASPSDSSITAPVSTCPTGEAAAPLIDLNDENPCGAAQAQDQKVNTSMDAGTGKGEASVELVLDVNLPPHSAHWEAFGPKEAEAGPEELTAEASPVNIPRKGSIPRITAGKSKPPPRVSQLPSVSKFENTFGSDIALLKAAIARGGDPNEPDKEGLTPLLIACAKGDITVVQYLLTELSPPVSMGPVASHGWTPLMIAAGAGHLEVVKILLQAGASLMDADTEHGSSALMWACGGGCEEVIYHILDLPSCTTDCVNYKNAERWTPLMICCDGGLTEPVKKLVAHGARVDELNAEGKSALDLASDCHNRVVEAYLRNIRARSGTDFWTAVEAGDVDMVRDLLATNSHMVHARNMDWRTPLLVACVHQSLDMVQYLVEYGASDVNAADFEGTTALHIAIVCGNSAIARFLISIGRADLNLPDGAGWTPLMKALVLGDIHVIRHLVDAGAGVNDANHEGETVMDVAIKAGRSDNVDYLSSKGAFSANDVKRQIEMVNSGKRGPFRLW